MNRYVGAELTLQRKFKLYPGINNWYNINILNTLNYDKIALVICDMWDKHWCKTETKVIGELAQKMNLFISKARNSGVFIIHAPSDVISYYENTPQRERMKSAPYVQLPPTTTVEEPPVPINNTDMTCGDDPVCRVYKAWTKQHSAIEIYSEDGISENLQEIWNVINLKGIELILFAGVHTNWCVLTRPFALRALAARGIKTVFVRDMTDHFTNPRLYPGTTRQERTDMIVAHIEKYLVPTIESTQI